MEYQNLAVYLKVFFVSMWAWIVGYFQPLIGVVLVFFACFIVDFITGVSVSLSQGKKFRSYKARESIFKFLIYVGSFALLLAFGIEMGRVNGVDELEKIMPILKAVIYVAVWFESKSIIENLRILVPRNRFIAFLDYVLGVEFVKKISWLKNFLDRENKDNQNNNQS